MPVSGGVDIVAVSRHTVSPLWGATNEQMAADDAAIDAWVHAQHCGGETQAR